MALTRDGSPIEIIPHGIGAVTKSIKGRPYAASSVRLINLAHIGVNFNQKIYGDTLTWWQLASFALQWGTATTLLYTSPVAGWVYRYDYFSGIFSVLDNNGVTQYRIKTRNISDFGISWSIFTSHQFYFYASAASYGKDAFLLAVKRRRGSGANGSTGQTSAICGVNGIQRELWWSSFVDRYFSLDDYHHRALRLFGEVPDIIELENEEEQEIVHIEEMPEILRSNVPVRTIRGDYSGYLKKSEDKKTAANISKERQAILELFGTMLMVAFFATISNRGKPVFEPWMLWYMWKWLGRGFPSPIRDTVFDIVPNWGY